MSWTPKHNTEKSSDQLLNAIEYLETHPTAKGVFLDPKGGICAYGGLLAGNGVPLDVNCEFYVPFQKLEHEKFNKAGEYLENQLSGGKQSRVSGSVVKAFNDTQWADSDFVIGIFECAREDALRDEMNKIQNVGDIASPVEELEANQEVNPGFGG